MDKKTAEQQFVVDAVLGEIEQSNPELFREWRALYGARFFCNKAIAGAWSRNRSFGRSPKQITRKVSPDVVIYRPR